jgi:hypothetical protein
VTNLTDVSIIAARNPIEPLMPSQKMEAAMRTRAKLFVASVLSISLVVVAFLSMSRGGEPVATQQQAVPHHPTHDPAMKHPEMIEKTETRTTDFGVSTTITRTSPMLVAPVIDGAKTPERIPDDVALRTLLETIALPAAPSPKEQVRVDRKLAHMGFNTEDLQVLREELRLYHVLSTEQKGRVARIRQMAGGSLSPTLWNALVQEDQGLSRLAVGTYDRLRSSLSPTGALRLQEHVAQIKKNIKITPPPKMFQ